MGVNTTFGLHTKLDNFWKEKMKNYVFLFTLFFRFYNFDFFFPEISGSEYSVLVVGISYEFGLLKKG